MFKNSSGWCFPSFPKWTKSHKESVPHFLFFSRSPHTPFIHPTSYFMRGSIPGGYYLRRRFNLFYLPEENIWNILKFLWSATISCTTSDVSPTPIMTKCQLLKEIIPLGPALHEAQGKGLVSIPVFITAAGLNENMIAGNRNGTWIYKLKSQSITGSHCHIGPIQGGIKCANRRTGFIDSKGSQTYALLSWNCTCRDLRAFSGLIFPSFDGNSNIFATFIEQKSYQ